MIRHTRYPVIITIDLNDNLFGAQLYQIMIQRQRNPIGSDYFINNIVPLLRNKAIYEKPLYVYF